MKIDCTKCGNTIKKDITIFDKIEVICDRCNTGISVDLNGLTKPLIYEQMGSRIILENSNERGYPTRLLRGDVKLVIK